MRCSRARASSRSSCPRTKSTSRPSEASISGERLMVSPHEVLEAVPQAEEAPPRPALHGAERRTELVGDLALGETFPVGELEHLAFPVGELRERGAHALRALLRRHLLRGRGGQRQGRSRRVPAPEQAQVPPARAQPVARARARHGDQKAGELPAPRVVGVAARERHEDLLRQILRLLRALEDGDGHPVHEPGMAVVERAERAAVVALERCQELGIRLGVVLREALRDGTERALAAHGDPAIMLRPTIEPEGPPMVPRDVAAPVARSTSYSVEAKAARPRFLPPSSVTISNPASSGTWTPSGPIVRRVPSFGGSCRTSRSSPESRSNISVVCAPATLLV